MHSDDAKRQEKRNAARLKENNSPNLEAVGERCNILNSNAGDISPQLF